MVALAVGNVASIPKCANKDDNPHADNIDNGGFQRTKLKSQQHQINKTNDEQQTVNDGGKQIESTSDKQPTSTPPWEPETYFIRGARKFLSNNERDLVWSVFSKMGKKTITSEDIKKQVLSNNDFKIMFNALVKGLFEGNLVGRQKAEQAIKSSYRSQARGGKGGLLLPTDGTAQCDESNPETDRDEGEHRHAKSNDVEDITHTTPDPTHAEMNTGAVDTLQPKDLTSGDADFERGPRRFLSDREKKIVKDVFARGGRKTITIPEIRYEVARNDVLSTMFFNLVESQYNGNKVGRQKAEQAIKSSFRYPSIIAQCMSQLFQFGSSVPSNIDYWLAN